MRVTHLLRHLTVVGVIVTLLIAWLLHEISPGEMTAACAVLSDRAVVFTSDAVNTAIFNASQVIGQLRGGAAKSGGPDSVQGPESGGVRPEPAMTPNASKPDGRSGVPGQSSSLGRWLQQHPAIEMGGLTACMLMAIWYGRQYFRFATEKRMSAGLVKAVRQMSDPEQDGKTLKDDSEHRLGATDGGDCQPGALAGLSAESAGRS